VAKILTQAEIDALLSTVAEDTSVPERSEGGPPRRVVLYDFKHPNLISKEQMRLLENIHENFSRNFGVFLSAQLRMIVEIELLAIDQLLYSEFVMSIAPPGVLYVIDMEDPTGQAIVELSPGLVIFIVEKLFGGKGSISSSATRTISAIEQKIMRRVMDRGVQELQNVWNPVSAIRAAITRYESNPEFIQIVPSAEPVVVVSLQIKIHDHKTLMNFCYPYRWISEIVGRPDVQDKMQFGTSDATSEEQDMLEDHVLKVSVPIRATLGGTKISIQDFINLQTGDLLVLKERSDEENLVLVKDKPMFRGVVGRREKNRAILITDHFKKDASHAV
jgi:flagellar motor switch protein FliM